VITAGEEATRIMTGATSLPPVSATMWQHVIVSLLWFALFAQWMTVVPIIVPDQVAVNVGGDCARFCKESGGFGRFRCAGEDRLRVGLHDA
jgi:hypothetical protein